jgi:hypothetical protein
MSKNIESKVVTVEGKRHRAAGLPRVSYNVREFARMTGRSAEGVRREIERRARPNDAGGCIAELPLGARAYQSTKGGRWSIVVPRALVAG